MTHRPRVRRVGMVWTVEINGRLHAAHRTHTEAWERAWAIATYAEKIRQQRYMRRIHAALERMENR